MSSLIVEVCKVKKIEKHPNADRLSIVNVKGWSCIVGLDNYKVGDLVVFVPPDCIVPNNIIYKYNLEYLKKNGRTSTVKLRGYISEGLVLDLPKGKWRAGDDASKILGIIKYEPPAPKFSVKGSQQTSRKKINPSFHKYTDIENVKNYDNVFQVGDEVAITEKIHGSNFRSGLLEINIGKNIPILDKISMWIRKNIFNHKYEYVVGSHNVQITRHSNRKSFYDKDIWNEMYNKYNIKDILLPDMIIYGEVYGEAHGKGIQDLTYGIKEHALIVFDIKIEDKYMGWVLVRDFCKVHGLPHVPELYVGEYYEGILEDFTLGQSILCPDQIREGIVLKMLYEEKHPRIGRKILKSINPEYLIRKDRTEYK